MDKGPKGKKSDLNIFYTYNLVTIIIGLFFYPLFPLLLNYPPGSINTKFNIEFSHIPYYQQYIIIILFVVLIISVCFKAAFKNIDKWEYINQNLGVNNIDNIKKIRQKSLLMPHIAFILQILIPLILVGGLFIVLGFHDSADIKFFMILITFLTLAAAISYLFSKKYFREVLKYTYIGDVEKGTTRIKLPIKILLQILPLILLSILFTSMLGQSGIVKEKGKALFRNYNRELRMKLGNISYIQNEAQMKQLFKLVETDNKKDITFFIDPYGKFQTQDQSVLSPFVLKYTKELAFNYEGHTYDYYGSDFKAR